MGTTSTDEDGRFEMFYSEKEFRELFEAKPDIYIKVLSPERELLLQTDDHVRWRSSPLESFDLAVDRESLGPWAPQPDEYPPETEKRLGDRQRVQAEADPPGGAVTEVGRIWLPKGSDVSPKVKRIEGADALGVHVPYGAQALEPPSIQLEPVSLEGMEGLDLDALAPGVRPEHLDLSFRPKLVEKLPPTPRQGEDLPEVVFAPDTRYTYNDSSFPWSTVGRVRTSLGIGCGNMIGRRLLLTASHNINWLGGGGAGWVEFTPAYYNGTQPFGVAWAQRVIYWNQAGGGLTDFETAFDYVVLVLDTNMGDLTGYPGYRTYSTSWNNGNYWQHMGYPGDLSGTQRPAFFGSGAISSVSTQSTSGQSGYVMGHFMDTVPGHSGGPYWGWWGNEPWPRVVGTHSAGAANPRLGSTAGDNEAGGGPALSSLIAYARSNYP